MCVCVRIGVPVCVHACLGMFAALAQANSMLNYVGDYIIYISEIQLIDLLLVTILGKGNPFSKISPSGYNFCHADCGNMQRLRMIISTTVTFQCISLL